VRLTIIVVPNITLICLALIT